jgi:hypothetical protein
MDIDSKSNKGAKWSSLGIKRSTYYKYKNLGLPDDLEEARNWIIEKVALAGKGGNSVKVNGTTHTAKDLIDLKGMLLKQQVENLKLKNFLERHKLEERKRKLVKTEEAMETLHQILNPLRAKLDQLPDNISSLLNPSDPNRAASVLESEINAIYADLQKSLKAHC